MLTQEFRRGAIGFLDLLGIRAARPCCSAGDAEELMFDFILLKLRRHHR